MSAPPPAPEAAAPPNLLHVQFKNPEYLSYLSSLSTHPASSSPLTPSNVLSYFATSPFFDRRSNNEQIRMQNIANPSALTSSSPKEEEEELRRFTGLEFVLVHAKPPTFVIQKRWRTSPAETTPLAAYYVVADSIYQAPDLYSVLATRLQSTVVGLRASLREQRRERVSFDVRRGHHGRFIVADGVKADKAEDKQDKDEGGAQQNTQDDDDDDDEDDLQLEGVDASRGPQAKKARFD